MFAGGVSLVVVVVVVADPASPCCRFFCVCVCVCVLTFLFCFSGKPQGTAARVNIGQVLISIRCKEQHVSTVIEALRRAKFKFPGRQKIVISQKWGFTPFKREEYAELRSRGLVYSAGSHAKFVNGKGPLKAWKRRVDVSCLRE